MVQTFDPLERYTGNGLLNEYTFDFTIKAASQLLAIVLDDDGEEIERFRGDDADPFMSALVFDEEAGGGTITLTDPLEDLYTLILIQAPDEPVQNSNLKTAGVFSLSYLETAIDKLGIYIQRVSWLANRSLRIHDAYNTAFDPQLPLVIEADRTVVVDPTGTALALGPTLQELLQAGNDVADAEAAAAAALAAQVAAENAQIAAENAVTDAEAAEAAAIAAAALAVAEAPVPIGPFACNQNATTNLTGEVTASGTYTQVDYVFRVLRGTTVFARIAITIVFRDGAWELFQIGDWRHSSSADSGVTFTVHATTGQIAAVVDNLGAGNATITGKKINWAA